MRRTKRGKFSSLAEAGRFAPSGVVMMESGAECDQPGYWAEAWWRRARRARPVMVRSLEKGECMVGCGEGL